MKGIGRFILLGLVWIGLSLFFSCQDSHWEHSNEVSVPEGYVAVSFKAQIPDMQEVQVRAVDPDGLDIHNMKLFCFNTYGLFITVAYASDFEPDNENHTGTYDAVIPTETTTIHFVANQNLGQYELSDFAGKSEAEVLSAMDGGSGMMIYWARFKKDVDSEDEIKEQLQNADIVLLRNQAKVSIVDADDNDGDNVKEDDWKNTYFEVTGYRTTNIHAFGTVAPYHETDGFDFTTHNFVTLPTNKAKLSDIVDINTKKVDYIFEHENTLDNPVSVIIKGKNYKDNKWDSEELYYRVLLMDDAGNLLPVLRNHHYQLNIKGNLSYGQKSFEEALVAPATNNVWVAVDDWVNHVSDGTHSIMVKEPFVVLDATRAGGTYEIEYEASSQPVIEWLEGNNVAEYSFRDPEYNTETKQGKFKVKLLPMSHSLNQQTGTIILKVGKMYRKVQITVVKNMPFTPSWVAAQVYGGKTGEYVTLKFTIPGDCPESLFPFPVYVSVNDLDVRYESGQKLPVRLESEVDWWYERPSNGLGYMYEYMVEKPGVQWLYFESLFTHDDNDIIPITLEAKHFIPLTKNVHFSRTNYAINVPALYEYDAGSGLGYAEDINVLYTMVPQKKNAMVTFSLELQELVRNAEGLVTQRNRVQAQQGNGTNTGDDEFYLYSKYLDYYRDVEESLLQEKGLLGPDGFECIFDSHTSLDESNGRALAFNSRYKMNSDELYTIYLKTNRPKSRDVVRIASNFNYVNSNYKGREYRSFIFELDNYRPYRFAAQIRYPDPDNVDERKTVGTWAVDKDGVPINAEEPVDELEWTYEPNQEVDVMFDITSFTAKDEKTSVDPFGTAFDVYIDAPMLDIDYDRLVTMYPSWNEEKRNAFKEKFRKDPTTPGRFIYTVDADREIERNFGTDEVKIADLKVSVANGQKGEHKTLPFRTKSITSAGDITISSDPNTVVYFTKKFKVKNRLIEGNIQFEDAEGTLHDVPKDAFVAFVRTRTNARIGVMTITEDGKYSLNLRSEYVFDWTDKIELNYKNPDGLVYECKKIKDTNGTEYDLTLESLAQHKNVILTKIE